MIFVETLFAPAAAEAKADELRASDPDWTYVVNHDPTGKGYSFITIFDEDGRFVSKF